MHTLYPSEVLVSFHVRHCNIITWRFVTFMHDRDPHYVIRHVLISMFMRFVTLKCQICLGLNANEIQISYDKHHKVYSLVKSRQNTHKYKVI